MTKKFIEESFEFHFENRLFFMWDESCPPQFLILFYCHYVSGCGSDSEFNYNCLKPNPP